MAYAGVASSVTPQGHSLDLLREGGVNIVKIFAPEHGFSGRADAGEKVSDSVDPSTGIPIVSLYGKVRKPTGAMLADVDVIVFDIPDIGCRFNTKLITMQGMMEAAAAYGVDFVVFDPSESQRALHGREYSRYGLPFGRGETAGTDRPRDDGRGIQPGCSTEKVGWREASVAV